MEYSYKVYDLENECMVVYPKQFSNNNNTILYINNNIVDLQGDIILNHNGVCFLIDTFNGRFKNNSDYSGVMKHDIGVTIMLSLIIGTQCSYMLVPYDIDTGTVLFTDGIILSNNYSNDLIYEY